ncbi:MAG: amidase family protein [Burkholderiales bacterium]
MSIRTAAEFDALVARIKEQDREVKAWRAFSDNSALKASRIGEFGQGEDRESPSFCRPGEGRGPILFASESNGNLGTAPPNPSDAHSAFESGARLLEGLTVGVKDIIDVEGLPTRYGSPLFEDAPPAERDATVVARMRKAGAIIVGKTITTELATFVPAETRNPRDLTRTPGGSSSGSAAAVAAGHVDIAIGTQTAGSIIRPAAYCGVYGFKPSFGVVPTDGVLVQCPSFDTVGVFARSIEPIEAWMAAVSPDFVGSARPTRPLRIARLAPLPVAVEKGYEHWLSSVYSAWAERGHEIRLVTGPTPLSALCDAHAIRQQVESAQAFKTLGKVHATSLVAYVEAGLKIAAETERQAAAIIAQWDSWMAQAVDTFDLLVLPSTTGSAPVDLSSTGDPTMCRPASALGYPSLTIPAPAIDLPQLVSPEEIHPSYAVQIILTKGRDADLLIAAQALL